MTDELKEKCEKTFYSELYHFEETSQGLLIDDTTGQIYLKKNLDTYDKEVYRWLKANHNVHIPSIHSYWEEDGKLIVLEEYIQGKTLEALLSKGTLSEEERIRIVSEVCDALSFLHSASIPVIHRDIKPSNIMITNDGIVKLIDFDAAKVFHEGKNEDTTLIGTVGRAAPEQYGFGQSDARTDVYSMGLLIRELLPDDGRFTGIISKATAMDPKDRYQTMAELKTAVNNAVSKPAEKKSRGWMVIPVVGFVFILCIAAFYLGLHSESGGRSDRIEPTPEILPEKTETKLQDGNDSKPAEDLIRDDAGITEDPQAADETMEDSGLVIAETCWYISGSSTDSFVHYGVILENKNESKRIVYPSIRVAARDKNGKILGTDEMTGEDIMPGDHIALASILSLSDYESANDVNVDFTIASAETGAVNGEAKSTDFMVERVSDNEDDFFPSVTGEISSYYRDTVSVAISALFRQNGKLVACGTSYLDDLKPNEPTAFEVDLSSDVPDHDSVEIMVQDW